MTTLKVLILEDRPDDAELLVHALKRAGFTPQWSRVDTEEDYVSALAEQPEIILADYALPQFDALAALRRAQQANPDTPVIVVSGAMSEEACVDCLRHGAVDYLLKDRLARLGPAVEHALAQRRDVAARRIAEEASREHEQHFRAAFDNAPVGMAVTDLDGRIVEANHMLGELTAMSPDGLRDRSLASIVAPTDQDMVDVYVSGLIAGEVIDAQPDLRLRHTHGLVVWVQYSASLIRDPDGAPRHLVHQMQDVTGRRRAEQAIQRQAEQLASANAELTELDRLKTEFVATVSHELRTPLTSIRGYTEILADGDAGELPAEAQRVIRVIDQNSERLLGLIEDLLTFSRIEVGRLVLNARELDLSSLVERVCLAVRPALEKASLTLVRDVPAKPSTVYGDPGQLERVLLNLLTNAVKFTPDGGTVTVRIRELGRQVTISVADTGIGIPADEQEQLFTRFFRSSTAQDLAIRGTGLGLAIAKAIVDAHRGWIQIESAAGTGTTVVVGLPLDRGHEHGHAGQGAGLVA
jgi:PAS domain S-box-containing protein